MCLISKPQYLKMFSYLEIGSIQNKQIKVSSLVWVLILYCLCLHKKGKFSHWFDWGGQREDHVKTPGDYCLEAKGYLRPPETGEDISSRCYPTVLPQKESTLQTPWFQSSSFQDFKIVHFYCLIHPICRTLLRQLYLTNIYY